MKFLLMTLSFVALSAPAGAAVDVSACISAVQLKQIKFYTQRHPVEAEAAEENPVVSMLRQKWVKAWPLIKKRNRNWAGFGNFVERPLVAVLDSGIDPGVAEKEGIRFDYFDAIEGDSVPQDNIDHGNGILTMLGSAENQFGTIGAAPGGKFAAIRIVRDEDYGKGQERGFGIEFARVERAFEIAAREGIKVLNMSITSNAKEWPPAEFSRLLKKYEKDFVVVVAAGNSGATVEKGDYNRVPIGLVAPNLVVVGSADARGYPTPSSVKGGAVDIFSMEAGVVQWKDFGKIGDVQACRLTTVCGTSHSAPLVALALAMQMGLNPKMTPEQAKVSLIDGAFDVKKRGVRFMNPDFLVVD